MAQRQLSNADFRLEANFHLEEVRRLLQDERIGFFDQDDERIGFFDQDDDVESNPEQDTLLYSERDTESDQSCFDSDNDDSEDVDVFGC